MGARLGAIALIAMLVRAVVPAGYMLAQAETEGGRYLTVTMCRDHGGGIQVIDLDTGKPVDFSKLPGKAPDKPDAKHTPCVFAASAHVAPPLAVAEPVEFVTHYDTDYAADHHVAPGRGIPAPPPPSTGPPSTI